MKNVVLRFAGDEVADGVALVTGAGAGLGRVEALALAAAGASVVVNDVGDAADEVVDEIVTAGGRAVAARGDVSDWDAAVSLVQRAIDEFGDLNILVNNAGILRDRMIFSMDAEEWDAVLAVHLRGHAATCRAATAYWREQSKRTGRPCWARVVNTSSEAFLFGPAGQPNYAAAKAGIVALTLSVAHGAARYGVRANAIAPRARTSMTAAIFGPPPAGEVVDPMAVEHIAPVVVWLGSPAAEEVTGQVFVVYDAKVGVLKAPAVEKVIAASGDTWDVDELDRSLGAFLRDGAPHGFAAGEDVVL